MAQSTPVNANQLRNLLLENQLVPSEGPKATVVLLDFTNTGSYQLDGLLLEQLGYQSMIQTLFIDLSNTANALTVTLLGSGQKIVAKARTAGYYPVLCPNPPKIQFDSTTPGDNPIPVFLINVPIAGVVWATQ